MAAKYVVGTYQTEDQAVSAVNRLLEIGYNSDDISVLARHPERFGKIASLTDVPAESPSAVGRSAGAGIAAGGVLGGLGGLLLGLGALVIPGIGPFLAAGPIATTLGGIAAGGAVGGVVGALAGLGIDKEEAKLHEAALERGDLLVLVEADQDRYDRVNDIFRWPEEEYYRRYERVQGRHPENYPPLVDPVDPVNRPLDPPQAPLDRGTVHDDTPPERRL